MSDDVQDELLSAYLDGELADAERERVDRRLAADPAARQLLDELRAVRGLVQGLPRQQLPADFEQQVLREAQRLTLAQPPLDVAVHLPREEANIERRQPVPWRRRIIRPMVWSAAAVAAAIVLLVVLPDEQRATRTSVARRSPSSAAAPSAAVPGASPRETPHMEAADREEDSPETLAKSGAPRDEDEAPQDKLVTEPAADLLVIRCDVRDEAFRNRQFDQVLLRQQIALEAPLDAAGAAEKLGAAPSAPEAAKPAEAADTTESSAPAALGVKFQLEHENALSKMGYDVIYVEATPSQISATLDDLANQGDAFPNVTTEGNLWRPASEVLRRGRNVRVDEGQSIDKLRPQEAPAASGQTAAEQQTQLGRAHRLTTPVPQLGFTNRQQIVRERAAQQIVPRAAEKGQPLPSAPSVQVPMGALPGQPATQHVAPGTPRQDLVRALFLLRRVDSDAASREQ